MQLTLEFSATRNCSLSQLMNGNMLLWLQKNGEQSMSSLSLRYLPTQISVVGEINKRNIAGEAGANDPDGAGAPCPGSC